jgi:hypothetical protein
VGDEDAPSVGEEKAVFSVGGEEVEGLAEAEDNIEAIETESEEPADESALSEALLPEEEEAETVGGSPVPSTFCSAVGTPLTSPPPVASFLGLVPTKKAKIKSPPTTTKIRRPIFLLSGTLLPWCCLKSKRLRKPCTASLRLERWISFCKAAVTPPPRRRALR